MAIAHFVPLGTAPSPIPLLLPKPLPDYAVPVVLPQIFLPPCVITPSQAQMTAQAPSQTPSQSSAQQASAQTQTHTAPHPSPILTQAAPVLPAAFSHQDAAGRGLPQLAAPRTPPALKEYPPNPHKDWRQAQVNQRSQTRCVKPLQHTGDIPAADPIFPQLGSTCCAHGPI